MKPDNRRIASMTKNASKQIFFCQSVLLSGKLIVLCCSLLENSKTVDNTFVVAVSLSTFKQKYLEPIIEYGRVYVQSSDLVRNKEFLAKNHGDASVSAIANYERATGKIVGKVLKQLIIQSELPPLVGSHDSIQIVIREHGRLPVTTGFKSVLEAI